MCNDVFLGSTGLATSNDMIQMIILDSTAFGRPEEKIWKLKDISYYIKYQACYSHSNLCLRNPDTVKKGNATSLSGNNCLRAKAGEKYLSQNSCYNEKKWHGLMKRIKLVCLVKRRGEIPLVYKPYNNIFPANR